MVLNCFEELCSLVDMGNSFTLHFYCLNCPLFEPGGGGSGSTTLSECLFYGPNQVTSSVNLFFQIFVIPVLIGLLFELLVIVPMRVPIDESPVFLLYQDWALGLIFLKIWTRLVSL